MRALAIVVFFAALVAPASGQDPSKLFSTFGVPSAPAFEFLPDRPSQVTHVSTASDLRASASQLILGGTLGTTAAIDVRPFAFTGGNLRQYREDPRRRALWRTAVSLGTAPAGEDSPDVIVAAGIRIPLFDAGDPRASFEHTKMLLDSVAQQFDIEQPPDPDIISSEWMDEQLRKADAADRVRQRWQDQHWNARRVEIGLAASALVGGAELDADSLGGDRVGVWIAGATGVGGWAEVSLNGKTAFVSPDSADGETARHLAGTRLRIRPVKWLAIAGEASHTWRRRDDDSNDDWWHFSVGLEIPTGFLSEWLGEGWIVVAWGTDASREGDSASGWELRYNVSRNRVVP